MFGEAMNYEGYVHKDDSKSISCFSYDYTVYLGI